MIRLIPPLGGLPRSYWYLCTGALINRLGAFVFPFLAIYLTEQRGYSLAQAGRVVALYGAGSLCSGPIGGWMADHLGRRRTLLIALCCSTATMIHLGFAASAWRIAVGTFALGLIGDLYRPAIHAAVADLIDPEDRPRAYGFLYWAVNLGFSVAAIAGGTLANYSFSLLFACDAVTTALFAGVIYFKLPETRPARTEQHRLRLRDYAAPYRDRIYLGFVFLTFITAVIFNQSSVALPLDMRAHGLSARTFGLLVSLNGVMIVLLQPAAVPLVQQFRRSRVLALAAVLIGLGFGLTGLAHRPSLYLLSIAVWTFGEIASSPLTPTIVSDFAPSHLRGSYQGALQISWGCSAMVAPAIGSWTLGKFGSGTLWLCCFLAGLATAAGYLLLGDQRRPAVAVVATPD